MSSQAWPLAMASPEAKQVRRPRPSAPRFSSVAVGWTILVLLVGLALFGPVLYPVNPAAQSLTTRLAPPVGVGGSIEHPLGTDGLGRDLLARVIAGARLSLVLGGAVTALAAAVGITLGLLAAYRGGLVDAVVTWLADVQLALPFVMVAIVLTAVLGNGVPTVVAALALTGWVGYARVLRLEGRALRSAAWVEAARAVGASGPRLVGWHLLPNLLPTILILVTQQIAGVILFEAALSYLGLGVGGSTVTWGGMVATGQEAIFKAWWVSVVPGVAIALTVLGLTLASGELRDSARG